MSVFDLIAVWKMEMINLRMDFAVMCHEALLCYLHCLPIQRHGQN